jgi:hypothetical protein
MSSLNSTLIISIWNKTSARINCSLAIFLFIFGTIGNILNIFVLSQRTLRYNPCAWLFYVSSIFNLISIVSGLSTRILSSLNFDITDRIEFLCQLRAFTLLTSRTIAYWLIMLAIFDRWLLSCINVHYRRLSKLKNAKQGMMIIIIISIIIYSLIFYCYEPNLINTPLKCYSKTIKCRILTDQIYTFVTILIPLILMILFGFLTISNVRKMHYRAQISFRSRFNQTLITREYRRRFKSIDRHLLVMLLVQISFLTIFTLPQTIEMIYLTITTNQFKSSLQNTIENSIFTFSLLLTYLASGIPFYIYTLSGGRLFRERFFILIRQLIQLITCQKK